jgi:hypothetical protein
MVRQPFRKSWPDVGRRCPWGVPLSLINSPVEGARRPSARGFVAMPGRCGSEAEGRTAPYKPGTVKRKHSFSAIFSLIVAPSDTPVWEDGLTSRPAMPKTPKKRWRSPSYSVPANTDSLRVEPEEWRCRTHRRRRCRDFAGRVGEGAVGAVGILDIIGDLRPPQ